MKSPYAYIAIEGNIGAGKTTFATWLAKHLGGDLLLEQFQENPCLEKFYTDPERFALSVELAFVSDRYRQLRERLGARNLFRQLLIADYSFVKSQIFAKANLPAEEFRLFQTMFKLMDAQIAKPEVVAILDPNAEKIRQQIKKRGRSYEQDMPQNTSTKSRTTTNGITGMRGIPSSGLTRLTSILSSARATRNGWLNSS